MQRVWLIFSQTVGICLALLFIVATLKPNWVSQFLLGTMPYTQPTATVKIKNALNNHEQATLTTTIITSYADAVNLASPSVVNIYTTKKINSPVKNLPDVPALRPFIEKQTQRLNAPTDLGSGVIATKDGYILTNYHVVKAANSIEVALYNGKKYSANLIGADPDTDLAVLKIEASHLQAIPVDKSQSLNVGDVVLAIGNPFDVGQTTTMGIISALGRSGLGINTYENFIQTDAAINPGNSGGALINVNGNLIGINTAIYSEEEGGGYLGIGFATPASTAFKIMEEIIENGSVSRGWLGFEPQAITADLAKAFNLQQTKGVIIASIFHNSPAEAAQLAVGDIITAINGNEVVGVNQIMNDIATFKPGASLILSLIRAGQPIDIKTILGKRPATE